MRQRPFVSVRTKLAVGLFTVLVIACAAAYVALSRFEHRRMVAAKAQAAAMSAQLFLRSAAASIIFDDETGMKDAVHNLARDPQVLGVELWSTNADGKIGRALVAELEGPAAPPVQHSVVSIDVLADRLVVRDLVHDRDGAPIAAAAIQFSLADELRGFAELRRRLVFGAGAMAIAVGALLWWLSRRSLLSPLDRLRTAVTQMEAGQHVEVIEGMAHDEIGRLAHAFVRMADVVATRERAIARRNDDMKRVLDNVGQGFLVVDIDGSLASERSAVVDVWFGVPREGDTVVTYFARVDERMAGMLDIGLEALRDGFMPLEVCIEQLPTHLERNGTVLRCAYHAITEGDVTRKVVLVITDVTVEVERDAAERGQRDLIAAVSRLLSDRAGFLELVHEADALVTRILDEATARDALLRDLHTLKGMSAIFGLDGIAKICHGLEDEARDGEIRTSARLRDAWHALRTSLSQLTDASSHDIVLSPDDYDDLVQAIHLGASRERLFALTEKWAGERTAPRLERLREHAVALAKRLQKPALEVHINDEAVRLPRDRWSSLWSVLPHLVRNAVDHGVDTAEERAKLNKPIAARLFIATTVVDGKLVVTVSDDGRGIDWERLRDKATALDMPAETQSDLVDALFADGVSTRDDVTETSGRGIGLAAVRHAVEALGGTINTASRLGRGTTFRIECPLDAPARLVADDDEVTGSALGWLIDGTRH